MERSPQDKGLFEKSALCCGEDPHRQYCELQTERANDRTADDPARNAACKKNEFHGMPPEMKKGGIPPLAEAMPPLGLKLQAMTSKEAFAVLAESLPIPFRRRYAGMSYCRQSVTGS